MFGLNQNTLSVSSFGVPTGQSNCALRFAKATDIKDLSTRIIPQVLMNNLSGWNLAKQHKAIYPMISDGVSVSRSVQTSYNLVDPRDSDDAYRITWSGGITFANTGVTGNASTGVGDSHFTELDFPTNSEHMSYWCRTNVSDNNYCMGTFSPGSHILNPFRSDIGQFGFMGSTSAFTTNGITTSGNSVGYSLLCRTSQTSTFISRNGISAVTAVNKDALYGTDVISILGITHFTPTNKECAFSTIGSAFTIAESSRQYNIVKFPMTLLNR